MEKADLGVRMPKTVSYWLTVSDEAGTAIWDSPVIGYEENGAININARETEHRILQRLRELAVPGHSLSWEKAWEVVPEMAALPSPEQEVR